MVKQRLLALEQYLSLQPALQRTLSRFLFPVSFTAGKEALFHPFRYFAPTSAFQTGTARDGTVSRLKGHGRLIFHPQKFGRFRRQRLHPGNVGILLSFGLFQGLSLDYGSYTINSIGRFTGEHLLKLGFPTGTNVIKEGKGSPYAEEEERSTKCRRNKRELISIGQLFRDNHLPYLLCAEHGKAGIMAQFFDFFFCPFDAQESKAGQLPGQTLLGRGSNAIRPGIYQGTLEKTFIGVLGFQMGYLFQGK